MSAQSAAAPAAAAAAAEPGPRPKALGARPSSSGAYTSGVYTSHTEHTDAAHKPLPSCPEDSANYLNQLSFWWLNDVVARGAKVALEESDLYEVPRSVEAARLSEQFELEWKLELERQEAAKQAVDAYAKQPPPADPKAAKKAPRLYQPSLWMACYRIFKASFWLGGVCKVVIDALQFLQPILLEWLLTWLFKYQYLPDGDKPPVWEGFVYATFIGVNPFITTILSNLYFNVMMSIGLKMRTIIVTQLYKKSLRLSPAAKQKKSTGEIVNMMSTDASKVDLFMGYIHYLWSALEQVIVAIALLIRAIGPSALSGVAIVIIMIPVQGLVMKHLSDLRKFTVKYTDARVKLMNEILQGIRVLKVYAWENSFLQKLIGIRTQEMELVRRSAYTRAWNSTIMQTGPLLMSLLAFITVGLATDSFKPQYIFSSLVLFNLLRMPLLLFPMTLSFWSDARIGVQRITDFLLAEELHSEPEYVQTEEFAIQVEQADFTWERVQAPQEDADKKEGAKKDGAAAPAGVGGPNPPPLMSPKSPSSAPGNANSAAEMARLLESPKSPNGTANGSTTITNGKDSISPVEEKEIVPFHLDGVNVTIPKGSLTIIVGPVGAGKSSLLAGILGEMKRTQGAVRLAGSVGYCPQMAWIQNATLKQNVLFGLPFDQKKYDDAIKYCALEADLAVLPAKDDTEIGEKGINLSGGQKQRVNLARAVYFDADIIMLDDPLSAVDSHVSKFLFNSCICDKLAGKTRVLVTHQLQYVSACDHVLFVQNGRITEQGGYQQLMAARGDFYTLMSTYVGEEKDDSSTSDSEGADEPGEPEEGIADNNSLQVPAGGKSKAVTKKGLKGVRRRSSSHADHAVKKRKHLSAAEKKKQEEEKKAAAALMQAEERTKGGVPWNIYVFYFKNCGGYFLVSFALFLMCLQTANQNWTTWWLGLWTSNEYGHSNEWYLGIYAALGLSQCLWALIGSLVSAYMGVVAALSLHDRSFASVLRAPMSFFDTTPIGRIISRFSKDQDVIDSLLMDTLRMIVFMFLIVLGTFIMILVVTPWFGIPLVPIMAVYWWVQKSYRETSRELKRLESIARSPLFAHFSESLTGLATIRAYRAQEAFTKVNQSRIDGNNKSYYLLVLTQRWLSIRVETIGALISFFAAMFIVIQRDSLNAGQAGVSLTYAIGVTALLNWVVRQTVEAENSMNSVERSKFYTDAIPQEAPAKVPETDSQLHAEWPQRGAVQFDNLQIRYRPGLPLVLHGISLNIKGGERVGIVGRTGAGKSSLMVALLRLVEAAEGAVRIDDVDISKIGLDILRSKVAIIPQDPVLYSGTVRSNLDPFNQYSDAQLWDVLEKAHLKNAIANLSLKLEEPVSEGGENFSVGERCQICLSRAMLKNARIMIMDEATASVDMMTDAWIQASLRAHFRCTLLTIAHRLNTICDYDKVLVLSYGRVHEFDSPANLLRDPNSMFSSMVDETGPVNAELLRQIAFKAEQGQAVDMRTMLAGDDANAPVILQAPPSFRAADGDTRRPSHSHNPEVSRSQVVWHLDEEDRRK